MGEKLKLNLGCAVIQLKGYINIDKYVKADIKLDLLKPLLYKDKTVDEILLSHVLEHFTLKEGRIVIRECHRLLKDDGILHIRVPDLPVCMVRFLQADTDKRWNKWLQTIYGGQWNLGEFHKTGFSEERLIDIMEKYGFGVKAFQKPREDKDPEIDIIFNKIK